VEIRNKNFLHPEYFSVLKEHNVAHVFNSWSDMPPVSEQMALASSRTNSNLCAARFLLKPGRKYAESVKMFEPYDKVKDPNPDARAAFCNYSPMARSETTVQPLTAKAIEVKGR